MSDRLLESLWSYFSPDNKANALRKNIKWRSVRLSLAGGEPTLLGDRLVSIAHQAKKLGFSVSLISNGTRLSRTYLNLIAPQLSILGISVDSISAKTNYDTGRMQKNGAWLNIDDLGNIVDWARSANPNIFIKVNTVVSTANADEIFSHVIEKIAPDKWKILSVLPIVSKGFLVEQPVFDAFVTRHKAYSSIISVENNDQMTQSYIMINPHGQFFQNTTAHEAYHYSDTIEKVGTESAFLQVPFAPKTIVKRY